MKKPPEKANRENRHLPSVSSSFELRHRALEALLDFVEQVNKIETLDDAIWHLAKHTIKELDFEDYFKTYASMAEHAKENNVGFAIRGSGSSSLVVHALGISGIDPVKNGFLFERFLNKKRVADGALPDIDFDTSDQSSISKHLSTVFGADNIATLTNTNSIQKYILT